MSDKEAEYYEQRAGLNEPAPEEQDEPWIEDANKALDEFESGADLLPGRFDSDPTVARSLAKRDNLQRQIDGNMANVRMLFNAVFGIKR